MMLKRSQFANNVISHGFLEIALDFNVKFCNHVFANVAEYLPGSFTVSFTIIGYPTMPQYSVREQDLQATAHAYIARSFLILPSCPLYTSYSIPFFL
jgi:hypothetical protein